MERACGGTNRINCIYGRFYRRSLNIFSEMYRELERSGYDLAQRQRNKRNRMEAQGCTKTSIDRETTKIAIIEDDKKAKKIFGDIVARYAVKYIA